LINLRSIKELINYEDRKKRLRENFMFGNRMKSKQKFVACRHFKV